MKKLTSVLLAVLIGMPLIVSGELDTEYEAATDASAIITFAPSVRDQLIVKNMVVRHDNAGTIKFWASKGSTFRETPTAYPTNAATVVFVSNTDYGLTNSDAVVYYHAARDVAGYVTGLVDYRTISSVTTSNVTLSSGITSAGAAGDQIYELSQQGQFDLVMSVLDTNLITAAGAGEVTVFDGEFLFATPVDSPLYIIADIGGGTSSNVTLNVTVER